MIRVRLPAHPAEHVRFGYSPLMESVLSLHVLVGPRHHVLQHDWVRRARSLDPMLRREIDAFAFVYRYHLPDMLTPRPADRPATFEDELERLIGRPAELLLEEFGRPLYDHGGRHGEGVFREPSVRKTMLDRAAVDGERSLRLARLLIDDPAEFAGRFSRLLTRYWESAFAVEWERLEPLLRDSVIEGGRLIATFGIWPALGPLPTHCRVDRERGELRVDLPHEHSVAVSAVNPLVLAPSVFVWPHLLVNCDPPWPTSFVYAVPSVVRAARPRIPPSEVLRMLRALADDSRLRMLKLIAEQPRTTQELATLVGLSTAGASKSVRRLAAVGLVRAHRDDYYVVYSIAPNRLAVLSDGLTHFLEPNGEEASDGSA
jgi:DNA-binding transcriptional ArsR family regulator